jgi:hypothetical protein
LGYGVRVTQEALNLLFIVRIDIPLPLFGGRMASQLDKTKYKNKIADVETEAQLEDLAYLQEKKKRLNRKEPYMKEGENEPQGST